MANGKREERLVTVHVTEDDPIDTRADRFLAERLSTDVEGSSRSQIQAWIDEGRITLDGRAIKSSEKFLPGQVIQVRVPAPAPLELIPEDIPLDILFQDEHLLVVNKPAGLTVHPSDTQKEGTLVHALLHHVKDLSGIGGKLRPGIVHRIDKNTSGALLITKTDAAHQKMSEVFSKHEIERAYWAFCFGSPHWTPFGKKEVRIESQIGRSPSDRKKMSSQVEDGRNAITRAVQLESYGDTETKGFASLLECRLETGRTHQVRVHLTDLGYSILGDPTYGTPSSRHTKWNALPVDVRKAVESLPGQALHARVLGFEHPITGKPLRFQAPLPEHLTKLHEVLKNHGR
ncbi:MAG: RluA family pseudouridine synthase [Bdellovibrionales bacterium]|nr:RluA family pseudouridine synthase [Bdellovibrionales bacterium]